MLRKRATATDPSILSRFSLRSPRLCGELSKRTRFPSLSNEQMVFTFYASRFTRPVNTPDPSYQQAPR